MLSLTERLALLDEALSNIEHDELYNELQSYGNGGPYLCDFINTFEKFENVDLSDFDKIVTQKIHYITQNNKSNFSTLDHNNYDDYLLAA